MVRAPCCEKMGMKRGPWTPEEDEILITYIHLYGHSNWRALPKQAGLLRCGKSCRLRWTNYLRPDIKRGNFTQEEEDTIINLHKSLGNRWSTIASKLPGRTDNEIKNVWHTYLKKKLLKQPTPTPTPTPTPLQQTNIDNIKPDIVDEHQLAIDNSSEDTKLTTTESSSRDADSLQRCSSDISVVTSSVNDRNDNNSDNNNNVDQDLFMMDESFWSEVFSGDCSGGVGLKIELDKPCFSPSGDVEYLPQVDMYNSNVFQDMEFWYSVFTRAGELPEI